MFEPLSVTASKPLIIIGCANRFHEGNETRKGKLGGGEFGMPLLLPLKRDIPVVAVLLKCLNDRCKRNVALTDLAENSASGIGCTAVILKMYVTEIRLDQLIKCLEIISRRLITMLNVPENSEIFDMTDNPPGSERDCGCCLRCRVSQD